MGHPNPDQVYAFDLQILGTLYKIAVLPSLVGRNRELDHLKSRGYPAGQKSCLVGRTWPLEPTGLPGVYNINKNGD